MPARSNSSGKKTRDDGLARAIEVFVQGFAFTRSFTHPYIATRQGPLWSLRDAPRRGNKGYRSEEWIAFRLDPSEIDRQVRNESTGRFAICYIRDLDEPAAPIREGFKHIGYRLMRTEPFMQHSLARIPRLQSPLTIRRVMTQSLADRLARAAGSRQILPEHFVSDAPLRQYVALADDDANSEPVGWVRSITVGDATWCSNMYVSPAYRRRGIGRALLCKMLRDDRSHGAQASMLLASHTGAMLYPVVGYELIGELLLFCPKNR